MNSNIVEFNSVYKKFAKSLGKVLQYGLIDTGRSICGLPNSEYLRNGEFWALNDVSFKIKKGDFIGIIGDNGSGKSTLLKLLNGIFLPDKGIIKVKGRVAALIAAGAGFHHMLSGRENIYINGTILGMRRKEINRYFDQIVEFSGTRKMLDAAVKNYSSGTYVRLGFAIAIYSSPDILLLDEILSVTDTEFRKKAYQELFRLQKKGTSIICVSHEMRTILKLARETIHLKNGKIQAIGETKKIVRQYLSERS